MTTIATICAAVVAGTFAGNAVVNSGATAPKNDEAMSNEASMKGIAEIENDDAISVVVNYEATRASEINEDEAISITGCDEATRAS